MEICGGPSVRSEVDRLSGRTGGHAFASETDCETSNVAQKPSGNDNCKVCDNGGVDKLTKFYNPLH